MSYGSTSIQSGEFVCHNCRAVNKVSDGSQRKVVKEKFLLKVFKKLLLRKGPTLVHDSSLRCPNCDMDSIFWEIGNGARKICAMCDKEIE